MEFSKASIFWFLAPLAVMAMVAAIAQLLKRLEKNNRFNNHQQSGNSTMNDEKEKTKNDNQWVGGHTREGRILKGLIDGAEPHAAHKLREKIKKHLMPDIDGNLNYDRVSPVFFLEKENINLLFDVVDNRVPISDTEIEEVEQATPRFLTMDCVGAIETPEGTKPVQGIDFGEPVDLAGLISDNFNDLSDLNLKLVDVDDITDRPDLEHPIDYTHRNDLTVSMMASCEAQRQDMANMLQCLVNACEQTYGGKVTINYPPSLSPERLGGVFAGVSKSNYKTHKIDLELLQTVTDKEKLKSMASYSRETLKQVVSVLPSKGSVNALKKQAIETAMEHLDSAQIELTTALSIIERINND